jgi:hypothetical protein
VDVADDALDAPCSSVSPDDSSESSPVCEADAPGIYLEVEPGGGRRSAADWPPERRSAATSSSPASKRDAPALRHSIPEAPLEPGGLAGDVDSSDHPAAAVRDMERAIVAATLAGRHATAELLADRLREWLARDRGNVVRLDGGR